MSSTLTAELLVSLDGGAGSDDLPATSATPVWTRPGPCSASPAVGSITSGSYQTEGEERILADSGKSHHAKEPTLESASCYRPIQRSSAELPICRHRRLLQRGTSLSSVSPRTRSHHPAIRVAQRWLSHRMRGFLGPRPIGDRGFQSIPGSAPEGEACSGSDGGEARVWSAQGCEVLASQLTTKASWRDEVARR